MSMLFKAETSKNKEHKISLDEELQKKIKVKKTRESLEEKHK